MNIKLTLGEKIKDSRTAMKKTIAEVCSDIQKKYSYKISVGKLTEMENDIDKDFGYKTIIYLSKYFDVSADYLLGLSEIKSVDNDIKVACKVTRLSEEAVQNIRTLTLVPRYDNLKYPVTDILESFINNKQFQYLLLHILKLRSFIFDKNVDNYKRSRMQEVYSLSEQEDIRDKLSVSAIRYNEVISGIHLLNDETFSSVLEMRTRDTFNEMLNDLKAGAEQEAQKEIERIKAKTE
jgi:transcriptional regulator with XRE-family HTH domain